MGMISRSRANVKPTRHSPRTASRFGSGILPTHPVVRVPYTMSDEAAFTVDLFGDTLSRQEYDAREREYDEMLEQQALEMEMLDRYTSGHLPL